jgi:hypothetical protein
MAPSVTSPQTVTALLLGPNRNWINPTVSGPMLVSPIPSHQAWPTLDKVTVAQIVSPSTIGSLQSWPTTDRVAHVTLISGTCTIPTHSAWLAPVVTGGPKYIAVNGGIPPLRAWPQTDHVTGGAPTQGLSVYLGGVDVSEYLSATPSSCTLQSQTIGRWKFTCDLIATDGLATLNPQLGQTIIVIDHAFRVFMGCLTDVVCDRYLMTQGAIAWHLTATDKSGIFDHRIVTGTTYPAGSDVVTTILQIAANYLNGEGIVLTAIPPVGTFGALSSDLICNFITVTSAFDSIASDAGLVWWVDKYGVLKWSPFDTLPSAPFVVTESSLNWRNAQGKYGLTVTRTTTDYYNKLYAVSNLNVVPGSGSGGTPPTTGAGNTESFVFTPGQPGIRTNVNSSGVTVPTGIVCSTAISSVASLTVNGIAQTVVDFGAYSGQTPNPPDYLWFFTGPATGVPGPGLSPAAIPPTGSAIVITYQPYVSTSSSLAQYGDTLAPVNPSSGQLLGTCGSGIYEGVVSVKDISSQAFLNAIAESELSRIGGVPTIIDFETDYPGLEPGQALTVNIPLSGVNNLTTLITNVSGIYIAPTLINGGSFRWQVQSRSNLDPGNWVKWYERLIARTLNPLPILQYEQATFVLGAGSTLSSGVNLTNPYIVGRTGQVVTLMAAAATPPTGQTLTLQISVNGNPISALQVTIPGGSTALAVVNIPKATGLYLFAQDLLNVSAFYSGGGTKATAVTVALRWAM